MEGLTAQQAKDLLSKVGRNEITVKKPFSPLSLFISQFATFLNAVLAAGALFSFLISDVIDGVFILAILVLNAVFGFAQEYRAEKSLEKLKSFITPLARVIRNGKEAQIEASELVPGDFVILSEGERVPADGTLTTTHHIEIDESILTGESMPVVKGHHDAVFSGTLVTKGKGHLFVEQTGMQTRFGQIAQTLASVKPDKTPLQIKLDNLGKLVSFIALFVATLLIPLGLARGEQLVSVTLLAISAGIAAIPEGLPAVVTIALAIGVNRMAKERAIVRKMPVVETLGAVQIVLIDKTGTLTKNTMRVKKHWTHAKESLPPMLMACVLGNTASLIAKAGKPDFDVVGDKTDAALLLWAKEHLHDLDEQKTKGEIIEEYTFDPQTKTITILWKKADTSHVFVRGAPEAVLAESSLSKLERKHIEALIAMFAKEGLRVIGFGTKTEKHEKNISRDHLEQDLTFLGLVGIYDPPRDEARQAVQEAKRAGIHTIMVTGDNELTALTIAKEVGLIEKDEDVLTGSELDSMPDHELEKIVLKTRIFARTTPEHKLRLANVIKKLGFVVGVTGDGVNDALALKRADVGIAMGETGTDVAKEASDIILTDDNFATLVKAVEEGRTIYRNILTSITYLLTGNLSELTFIVLAAFASLPTPLVPTQILWINIVTDGLPALALAADVKDPHILKEEPRNPKAPFLSSNRIFFIVTIGLSLGISLVFTYKLLLGSASEVYARSFVFNALLFVHLIMVFAIRGKSVFHINKFLLLAIAASVAAQILVNILPLFQVIFSLQH